MSSIQRVPNAGGEYHRKPMMTFAAAATSTAAQFRSSVSMLILSLGFWFVTRSPSALRRQPPPSSHLLTVRRSPHLAPPAAQPRVRRSLRPPDPPPSARIPERDSRRAHAHRGGMRGDGSIDGLVRALPKPVDQDHFHPPPVGCGHANDELIPALEALARHRGSVDASCAELDS